RGGDYDAVELALEQRVEARANRIAVHRGRSVHGGLLVEIGERADARGARTVHGLHPVSPDPADTEEPEPRERLNAHTTPPSRIRRAVRLRSGRPRRSRRARSGG